MPAPLRRVAVTGLGVVSALGHQVASFWDSLLAGRSGIAPITTLDMAGFKFQNGAEVRGFDPSPYFAEEKDAAQVDRFSQFAYAAARQAVDDAGLDLPRDTAVITGCATGGNLTQEQSFLELYGQGKNRFHPMTIPRVMESAAASLISIRLGVQGPVFNVTSACASSNHAIGQALLLLQTGQVSAAITGGAEALFSLSMMRAWEALRVVAPDTCRPFALHRQGMILGEGAGMLMLEDLESAQGPRRAHLLRTRRLRHECRRQSLDAAFPAKRRPRHAIRRPRARRSGLHQRPRHRHAHQRSHRSRRHRRALPSAPHAGQFHQVHARPRAGRRRRP